MRGEPVNVEPEANITASLTRTRRGGRYPQEGRIYRRTLPAVERPMSDTKKLRIWAVVLIVLFTVLAAVTGHPWIVVGIVKPFIFWILIAAILASVIKFLQWRSNEPMARRPIVAIKRLTRSDR